MGLEGRGKGSVGGKGMRVELRVGRTLQTEGKG